MSAEKALYIGGWSNGRLIKLGVERALWEWYGQENVIALTFSKAIRNPDLLREAADGSDTITHSAGMLALIESVAIPESLKAFNPPISTNIAKLGLSAAIKTGQMYRLNLREKTALWPSKSSPDIFSYSTVGEAAMHPLVNLNWLPDISRFNAFESGQRLQQAGTEVEIICTDLDRFYNAEANYSASEPTGLPITMLSGVHDQLALAPRETLLQVLGEPSR